MTATKDTPQFNKRSRIPTFSDKHARIARPWALTRRKNLKPRLKHGKLLSRGNRTAESLRQPLTPLRLQQILVPIDFSDCSLQVLQYAYGFTKKFKAQMILLYVIELYPVDYIAGSESIVEMNAGLLKQAQAELAELSQPYAQANQLRVETLVTLGKPFREITRVAKERKVQMIIMGTHGYTGFQHFQLGSTAERVVRYASCPVLVVRQQEHTALTPDQAGSEPLPKSDLTP